MCKCAQHLFHLTHLSRLHNSWMKGRKFKSNGLDIFTLRTRTTSSHQQIGLEKSHNPLRELQTHLLCRAEPFGACSLEQTRWVDDEPVAIPTHGCELQIDHRVATGKIYM